MERITAPYGFVPLSSTVVFPDWVQPRGDQAPPLHDVPFSDGISGALVLEIEAETPIFTRGASDPTLPFQLPDRRYAIPGTAVRGALRNVLEIATFSRFQRVNRNHRYAVRDLQNRHLYGQYMAEIVRNPKTNKGEPMPLVNAGWLRQHGEGEEARTWTLEVCDFGKLEYLRIMEVARQRGLPAYRPGDRQSSVRKYRTWQGRSLELDASLDARRPDMVNGRAMVSRYGVATPAAGRGQGVMVFTGQPNRWSPDMPPKPSGAGNPKHHDFVFFPAARPRTFELERQVFEDFEFAHSDRGQQNNLGRSLDPNEEWGHWRPILEDGGRVPVFFLTDPSGQKVTDLGLAMMFRMPYRHSIGDAVDHANPAHGDPEAGFDFAEGLFGTVRSGREGEGGRRLGGLALKGRVGISHAVAEGGVRAGAPVSVILGAPKASYYPNYVEQDPEAPGSPPPRGGPYKTWNDADCRPRGWKRYRPLTATWQPPNPTGGDGRPLDPKRVGTTFCPLPAGTRFQAHVDLHNVRPVELGALLWTLDFGGDRAARHTLGLARPLGYGRVRFQVKDAAWVRNDGRTVDPAACLQAFEDWMGEQVQGWRTSPQIRELLALARPVDPKEARYQRLDPGARVNEFVEAKKASLALPSAAGLGRRPEGGGAPGRPPGPGSPGRPAGPSRPAYGGRMAPPPARGPIRKPGEPLRVVLKGLSKKQKWQCEAVEFPGFGGTIQGDAPEGVTAGQEHTVKVVSAATPSNMVLSWN